MTQQDEIRVIDLIETKYPKSVIIKNGRGERKGYHHYYMDLEVLDWLLRNEEMDIIDHAEIKQYVSVIRKNNPWNIKRNHYRSSFL